MPQNFFRVTLRYKETRLIKIKEDSEEKEDRFPKKKNFTVFSLQNWRLCSNLESLPRQIRLK